MRVLRHLPALAVMASLMAGLPVHGEVSLASLLGEMVSLDAPARWLISWQPTKLLYAMTTYWYAFPGAACNLQPQPQAAAMPVPNLIQ